MDLNSAKYGIDKYILDNKEGLKTTLRSTRNDNEDNIWVYFNRYHQETSVILANSFINNVDDLKIRLNNFVSTSLECLNEERYTIVDNSLKLLFYNIVEMGLLDTYSSVTVSEFSDSEKKELLEYLCVKLVNEEFLGDSVEDFTLVGFDENYVEDPAVKELLGYSFLSDSDYTNSFKIIKNHIEAINMITEGNIPPYNGELLNINDLDILINDNTGVDSQVIPQNYPDREVPLYNPNNYNDNYDDMGSDIN